MKLNRIERMLMNNPVRAVIQRNVDAALFERLGGKLLGQRALEIGCGRGVGVEILLDRFEVREVDAFDLDLLMIEAARRRLAKKYPLDCVRLNVGDASAIPHQDATFDAVFDFGAIHHIPDWRAAVREVRRVLRPGGQFYFMEVTKQCLNRWIVRTFLDHPRTDRFSAEEFIAELEHQGMGVQDNFVRRWFGDLVLGVAQLGEPTADNRSRWRPGAARRLDSPPSPNHLS